MATASAILWLRRIASCFFLTLAILFAALWVRSYFRGDSLRFVRARESSSVFRGVLASTTGLIFLELQDGASMPMKRAWEVNYHPFPDNVLSHMHKLGFYWRQSQRTEVSQRTGEVTLEVTEVILPYWLPFLTSALLAIAIRPQPRLKFSLLDLLTLTTVAALTVGPLAFWLRSIG